ncbi:ATP-binding response regulator [Anatilimnocola floriformis]|uniref:ATP-binding response regulator n=1 Tax=Anatilimnocola floriformis TaxID=2948575 RepID=UPI0020C4762C|nr:response regulator [Anatilimnocola floriformis]
MSLANSRILVVDDNPATRYSTTRVLKSAGFHLQEAGTGTEALAIVAQGVDLVVLDINLPDIDGFEVCRQIRASERMSRLPVVHLSATFVKDVDKAHGLDVGANGYLTHPVEPPVLIATVSAFLRAWRAEQEREALLISERAAREEAESANRFKDEFLATLSHELRTPLQAIIGWTQLLKTGSLDPQDLAEGIRVIERNAQLQTQLISDLLDVARITSGKLRLDVQPVDPATIIESALIAVLPAAQARGMRIQKMLDTSTGTINGDPARLQQVVWNLVNNAVKFTQKGGKVEVTLRRINSHVEIVVADNGPGIAPELLPSIFDRFRQGDSTITRSHGGLGLGLAIAKQLVELHGGQISAHSDGLGMGAKFSVVLPLAVTKSSAVENFAAATAGRTDDSAADTVKLDGVRVLIVDDDNDSRNMLVRLLKNCGAETRDLNGATQVVAAVNEFQPHLLISDLGMPSVDGFELIRSIRSGGYAVQTLPAIALTGFASSEDRRKALLAGFQAHMAKPVDPRELTGAIATLLGRTGQP